MAPSSPLSGTPDLLVLEAISPGPGRNGLAMAALPDASRGEVPA